MLMMIGTNTYKLLLLLLIGLTLTGCTTLSVTAPVADTFSEFEAVKTTEIKPVAIPKLPKVDLSLFTEEQKRQIIQVRESGLANEALVNEMVKAYNSAIRERNALIELGKISDAKFDFMAQRWADSEEARARDKQEYLISEYFYKSLLLLGLVIGL